MWKWGERRRRGGGYLDNAICHMQLDLAVSKSLGEVWVGLWGRGGDGGMCR